MYVVCEDCRYSMKKEGPGDYYCPDCGKIMYFQELVFGCGSKPQTDDVAYSIDE